MGVIIVREMVGTSPHSWSDAARQAVALASSGGIDRRLTLPPVARLIGGTHLAHRGEPALGELNLPLQELYAVTGEMNMRGYRAQEY